MVHIGFTVILTCDHSACETQLPKVDDRDERDVFNDDRASGNATDCSSEYGQQQHASILSNYSQHDAKDGGVVVARSSEQNEWLALFRCWPQRHRTSARLLMMSREDIAHAQDIGAYAIQDVIDTALSIYSKKAGAHKGR
jgi:hypothetical protein